MSKEPAQSKSAISKPPSPKPKTLPATQQTTQSDLDVIIQRAEYAPDSLTPHDIGQLQRTMGNQAVGQLLGQKEKGESPQKKENNTSLPDDLKSGIENLSNISMDDVKVHYNSAKPDEVQALAYTQGTEIHLGPGQEKHLPHEAWHVVQQKQGRVRPTLQFKRMSINDDKSMEQEATLMGARALQTKITNPARGEPQQTLTPLGKEAPIQLLSKTVGLGNSQTAQIEYSLGAGVEEFNNHQLSAELFQEMGSFICSSNLDVTLSTDLEEPLEFGFIANVMSSTRTAFYNSTKRTKVSALLPKQTLDGDGNEPPFAVPSIKLPKTAGTHSIKLQYSDNPLAVFPRKDPNAEGEGNTLVQVSGKDVHKVWLIVGNPNTGGLTVIDSIGWEVTWNATINNDFDQVEIESGGNLRDDVAGGPVWEGEFSNDSFKYSEETW